MKDKFKNDIPEYYKGKNGYMAKDVVSNFDLSYNIGTAVTYLIRSKKKHNDKGLEDIQKAINHLNFEIDNILKDAVNKIPSIKETLTGALSPTGVRQ
tara:strand:+ start:241 stop:531 length:291 start_codon:yes stop_codon:yes gene_type:complete